MLDQSLSLKNFKRLISFRDFGKYDFGKEETEIIEVLNDVVFKTNQPNFNFSHLEKII